MRTHFVTTTSLDDDALTKDLEQTENFVWSEAYSDYVFGGAWKNCMLWSRGGVAGDGVVTHYDHDQAAAFTPYGDQVPYLRNLIATVADLDRLNFVRLVKVQNSVIIPHRDLLELGDLSDETRNAHRMHIPLVTNENCFFSEADTVFRMAKGEIWFLDASQIHSVAVLSDVPRLHLMLDFVDVPSTKPLLTVDGAGPETGIPDSATVVRPPLPESERSRLLALADVLAPDTFREIFSIVIKKHYRYDCGPGFVWDTMIAIAAASQDPKLLEHAHELRRHYTLERSA